MATYDFLIAVKNFNPDEIICELGCQPCLPNNPKRIQVDETTFILPPAVIFHSCNPNSYIDWMTMQLKALKPIAAHETITYHYGTSEDNYSIGAFTCACGSKQCLKKFRGFKYMNVPNRETIKSHLSPFLLRKYYSQI